jgi:phosphate transport system substrate-binding protein
MLHLWRCKKEPEKSAQKNHYEKKMRTHSQKAITTKIKRRKMNLKFLKSKVLLATVGATLAAISISSVCMAAYGGGTDVLDAWNTSPMADLRVAGSTTVWPIVQQALNIPQAGGTSTTSPFQAYANPSGTIFAQVFEGGSGHGRSAVNTNSGLAGETNNQDANVGMSSSNPNAACVQDPIARDGVCMIVSDQGGVLDTVPGLTLAQIKGIYEGTITNWSQVGGPSLAIFPVARIVGSGTRDAIISLAGITDATELTYIASISNDPREDATSDAVAAVANHTAGAIGYVGVGYANSQVAPIRVLPISANVSPAAYVAANDQTVTNNTYPMSRFLFLIEGATSTATNEGPWASKLVTYLAATDAGQNIVKNQGFVMLNPRQDVNSDGTVNITDVVKIGLAWNKSSSDTGYVLADDVNRDGKINISDVVSVGLWWNITELPVPANQW